MMWILIIFYLGTNSPIEPTAYQYNSIRDCESGGRVAKEKLGEKMHWMCIEVKDYH